MKNTKRAKTKCPRAVRRAAEGAIATSLFTAATTKRERQARRARWLLLPATAARWLGANGVIAQGFTCLLAGCCAVLLFSLNMPGHSVAKHAHQVYKVLLSSI